MSGLSIRTHTQTLSKSARLEGKTGKSTFLSPRGLFPPVLLPLAPLVFRQVLTSSNPASSFPVTVLLLYFYLAQESEEFVVWRD